MKLQNFKQFLFVFLFLFTSSYLSFAGINWYEKPIQFDDSKPYRVSVFQEEEFLLHWPFEDSMVPINIENNKPVLLIQHEQEELLKESDRQESNISNKILQLWYEIANKTDANYFIEPPLKLMLLICIGALISMILMSFVDMSKSILICIVSIVVFTCMPKYEIEYYINDSGSVYKIKKNTNEKDCWVKYKNHEKVSLIEVRDLPDELSLEPLNQTVWNDYNINVDKSGVHRGYFKEQYFLDCK